MSIQPAVIFTVNRAYALTNSRTLLIQHFLASGWKVVLATAEDPESHFLCKMGAHLEPVGFYRGSISPLADIKAYHQLLNIYKKWRPALIQHFHAKPVILGSLAAKRVLDDKTHVVNTITGLGRAFNVDGIMSKLAGLVYAMAKPRADIIIFQNRDDLRFFLARGWVEKSQARLIPGSGVDLKQFQLVDRQGRDMHAPVIVMLGRLLKQKGIHEFVEVAKRIQANRPQAKFLLAGEEDLVHPDAVTAQSIKRQGFIEYLGRLTDVLPLLTKADIFLFPSYYKEGLPRVVLEASATGLPTVAFDMPGVREAVQDGKTGYLVLNQDVEGLAQKIEALLDDEEKRLCMGLVAREMVEREFDVQNVKERYLDVYRELGIEI